MSADRPGALGQIQSFLVGRPTPTLPAQKNWWGWLRAALAFQPALLDAAGAAPESLGRTQTSQLLTSAGEESRADEAGPAAPPADRVLAEELHQELRAWLPVQRLTLRRHPVVIAGIRIGSLVTGLSERRDSTHDLVSTLDGVHARAVVVADTHERTAKFAGLLDLDQDLAAINARVHGLDQIREAASGNFPLDRAGVLVREIDQALDRALDRARGYQAAVRRALRPDLWRCRMLARTRVRELEGARTRVRELVGVVDRARERDLGLQEALGRARDDVRELLLSLEHGQDHAAPDFDDLLTDLTRTCEFVRSLVSALNEALNTAGSVIQKLNGKAARGLGMPPADVIVAVLGAGVLDDFTDADLSSADLTGIDLEGVRWSEPGTRWPPGEEVRIRRASHETAPGSGIWVVVRGSTTADTDNSARVNRPAIREG